MKFTIKKFLGLIYKALWKGIEILLILFVMICPILNIITFFLVLDMKDYEREISDSLFWLAGLSIFILECVLLYSYYF